ncbi:hypothetical protein ACF1GW_10550 [Streptomyces achromogenes]|uniref:hypothetical protein n=1 Tax=Streptomyces achromogenes TaxID=67255 RepID=UPI0036FF651D
MDRLPGGVREFARYLSALLARLDPRAGWYGVFWQRDPEGMRACLDGREVAPWDVVEALLEDVGATYGAAVAAAERARARALRAAAVQAYDARPGARDALAGRLDVMLRERRHAARRHAELTRLLSAPATPGEAESLSRDLAWAQDDHERATARCTDLRARLTALDRSDGRTGPAAGAEGRPGGGDGGRGAWPAPVGGDGGRGARPAPDGDDGGRAEWTAAAGDDRGWAAERAPAGDGGVWAAGSAVAGVGGGVGESASVGSGGGVVGSGKPRKRRRGSARFAGVAEEGGAGQVAVPPAAEGAAPNAGAGAGAPRGARFAGVVGVPVAPGGVPDAGVVGVPVVSGGGVPDAGAGVRVPRGARFAGVDAVTGAAAVRTEAVAGAGAAGEAVVDDETVAVVGAAVERLARLRSEGRGGAAHALLAEVSSWPAGWLPAVADALDRAGLGADWATLLWEVAALPVERMVAAAGVLAAAGRDADARRTLRQGVARPAEEIGAAVLRLADEGRHQETRALLDAWLRSRTPEEAARCAAPDPRRLAPLLLRAARELSGERHRDLVHALRAAGHPT